MQKLSKNKKGIAALNLLITGSIMMVIAFMILSVGSSVLTSAGASFTGAAAGNIDNGSVGLGNMASQGGLLGTVIVLTVVILILIGFLFRNVSQGTQ